MIDAVYDPIEGGDIIRIGQRGARPGRIVDPIGDRPAAFIAEDDIIEMKFCSDPCRNDRILNNGRIVQHVIRIDVIAIGDRVEVTTEKIEGNQETIKELVILENTIHIGQHKGAIRGAGQRRIVDILTDIPDRLETGLPESIVGRRQDDRKRINACPGIVGIAKLKTAGIAVADIEIGSPDNALCGI